jgi:prepilin-type N-terminal cleavage/methylation domain-containing protein
MNTNGINAVAGRRPGSSVRGRGFSLVEILVVVGLLSVIILGLVAMFSQTQRAFRLGLTQVDVLESGRAVTDMLNRELSQMTPARASNAVNFYASLESIQPLKQELPGNPAPLRTNLIEDLYFLTKENQTWTGIGYYVSPTNGGVGTLYRYVSNTVFGQNPSQLYNGYHRTINDAVNRNVFTNLNRIMDGVVHFKVRAYTPDGQWITRINQFATNQFGYVLDADLRPPGFALYAAGESEFYRFTNNVVPAFVELELGVLEERAIVRARTITDTQSRSNYLAREAGRVHLFRLRVPVRNVDPTAYQ